MIPCQRFFNTKTERFLLGPGGQKKSELERRSIRKTERAIESESILFAMKR